jgi:lysophospholipase L1-like esterase
MHLNRKLGSALVGLLAATLAWGDGAAAFPGSLVPGAPAYLALGDSVPFGFSPLLKPPVSPTLFVGYPLLLGVIIDEPVVNAACPGQTSSGFLSLQGTDNGCFTFRQVNALHVQYSGTQLEFAEQFVASHPHTQLVTIQLGANDLFLLLDSCGGDINNPNVIACVANQAPALINEVAKNVDTVIAALRQAGYDGQIILALYYSPRTEPAFRQFVQALDQGLAAAAAAAGVDTADLFAAFDAFSGPTHDACAAGLLIGLPATGGCDIHPSAAGAELIAETFAAVVSPRKGMMEMVSQRGD